MIGYESERGGSGRYAFHWMQIVAGIVGAVFLAVLVVAWVALLRTGDDGTVNTYRLPLDPNGIIVADVQRDGPADRAGLRRGDVIYAVNGVTTNSEEKFHTTIHSYRAGEQIAMWVRRTGGGVPVEVVTLTLQPRLAGHNTLVDTIVLTAVTLLFMGLAVGVVLARPNDSAARVLFLAAGSLAASQTIALWVYGIHPTWVDPLEPWAFQLSCAAALHLFLVFPEPHPVLRRLKRLGPAPLQRIGGGTVLLYLVPLAAAAALRAGPPEYWPWWSALMAGTLGLGLVALVDNYRRLEHPMARAQARLTFVSVALGIFGFTLWTTIDVVPRAVMLVAAASFPISIGIAILRYRLFDIDVLVNRTLVYGALTTVLAVVYVGVVALLQDVFSTVTDATSNLAIVVSTLAIAALFNPLRRQIQGAIDRSLYRRQYEATQMLVAFSTSLRDDVYTDMDYLCNKLASVIDETMEPTEMWMWVRPPEQD